MFDGRLPAALADRAPKIVETDDGARCGATRIASTRTSGSTRSSGGRKRNGAWSPRGSTKCGAAVGISMPRIADMDLAGIWASLNFPSLIAGFSGTVFWKSDDPELGLAVLRAWNDWHLDAWAGAYPDRIIPLQLPWLADPQLAAEELRRNADARLQGRELPRAARPVRAARACTPGVWDPFLAACEETDTVICLHTGSAQWAPIPAPDTPFETITTLFPVNALVACADWLWSGIPVRFPKLNITLDEGGLGWVAMLADRADFVLAHSGVGPGGRVVEGRPAAERGAAAQLLVLLDRRPVGVRRARRDRGRAHPRRERLPARRLDVARHASTSSRATSRTCRPTTPPGSPTATPQSCSATRCPDGGWLADTASVGGCRARSSDSRCRDRRRHRRSRPARRCRACRTDGSSRSAKWMTRPRKPLTQKGRRSHRASSTCTHTTTRSCSGIRPRARRCSTASPRYSAATAASRWRPRRPSQQDYLTRMLARVEGMPLDALRAGLDWQWASFGDWLAPARRSHRRQCRLPGWPFGDSAGGHGRRRGRRRLRPRSRSKRWPRCSVVRWPTVPWGCRRRSRTPTTTATGQPVPSRSASREELLALAAAVRAPAGHPARGDHPRLPVRLHRRRHRPAHRHVEGRRPAAELERAGRLGGRIPKGTKSSCAQGKSPPNAAAAWLRSPCRTPRRSGCRSCPASCWTGCRAGARRCTCRWRSGCGRSPIPRCVAASTRVLTPRRRASCAASRIGSG